METRGTRPSDFPGRPEVSPAWRALLGAAALVVLVAGLKAAAGLLLPVLLAAFLAVLAGPPVRRLVRRGLPPGIAIVIVMLVTVALLAALGAFVGRSVARFSADLPRYEERLGQAVQGVLAAIERLGLEVDRDAPPRALEAGRLVQLVSDVLQSFLSALSNLVVILLIAFFMLMEASGFPAKFRRALGDPGSELAGFAAARENVYRYVGVKTLMGVATGILTAIVAFLVGVDYPGLWGLLAFLFNFVPQIGSVVAAAPPVVLAWLQHGPSAAIAMATGKLAIDQVLGNVIEPRIMGRSMGLSPLVVFLSLLFWSFVWGAVGIVLAVPLTMVVKLFLDASPATRPIGILLGPAREPEGAGEARATG
jgi:AI-2 transport protein TqsA